MDHTPDRDSIEIWRYIRKTYLVDDKGTRSEEEIEEMLKEKNEYAEINDGCDSMCIRFSKKKKEIAVASHDDDTIEKVRCCTEFWGNDF